MEILVYRQGAEKIEEGFSPEDLPGLLREEGSVIWLDILGDTPQRIEQAANILLNTFHFHPLTVEDCVEERNQPKVEPFPDHLYFIVHGIKTGETGPENFVTKELDGYLGTNYVVTFHLEHFSSIIAVKQQLRATPFACTRGAAYLLHQILDNIVDQYMPVVEAFDQSIIDLEDRVFKARNGSRAVLEDIMELRRSVARLRRISARQREVLYRISHGEFQQIKPDVLPFYRDVHDHLLRITDLTESYRDLVSGLSDIHLSIVANRTNEVMKTLAIVSAIILPLSLIAGIYGMNFEHMPELAVPWAYFATLGLMVTIAVVLLIVFWWKGWILQKDEIEVEKAAQEPPRSDAAK